MKLTTLLLVIALVQASAKGYSQKISLNETNAPLTKVLSDIKTQSGYTFLYTDQRLTDQKVTIAIKAASIEETLEACFKNLNIDYKIVDKNVLLKLKEATLFDKTKALFAQVTVTGKVTNETGAPMIGVTVKIKNTNNATTTDIHGDFLLTVPDDKTIISFSFIGYQTQEFVAKDIPNGSIITLKASFTNLNEVVVNKGYYTVKKLENTGNVSTVTAAEIERQPVTDPIQALIGRVPGLDIQQSSGVSGANSTIRIRGVNSIANGNLPLYIVDGVPFDGSTLSTSKFGPGPLTINDGYSTSGIGGSGAHQISGGLSPFNVLAPNDIDNIEILKDADATAIYGSRGANGVILITTKKGKAGPTTTSVTFSQGIQQVGHFMLLLNTPQFLSILNENLRNTGSTVSSSNYDITSYDPNRYTDWQKTLIGNNAQYTNAQLALSGGNTNTQFLISGNYNRNTSVYLKNDNSSDQKGGLHFSLNHISTNQRFKIAFTGSYDVEQNKLPNADLTNQIGLLAPNSPSLTDGSGNINWAIQNGAVTFGTNPLQFLQSQAKSQVSSLVSGLNLNFKLADGLNLTANASYNKQQMYQITYQYGNRLAPPNNTIPSNRLGAYANNARASWIIEPQLNYSKTFGLSNLQVLVGTTFQSNTQNTNAARASGFSSDALIPNPLAASSYQLLGVDQIQYKYNALYTRLSYKYDERYIINLTGRRDGSSRFGPGHQWGNFGAVGAAWIFSNEKWIKDKSSWLDFGKIRASYGITGNDQTGDYKYLSTYSALTGANNYQGLVGFTPTLLANTNFGWEQVSKLEFGIELGVIHNFLNIEASYYRNRTSNQLIGYPLPLITGFSSIPGYNLPAVIQNKGMEVSINAVAVKSKTFTWNWNLNFTLPDNKLISFPGLASTTYSLTYAVGRSLFSPLGYEYTGVNPQTGLYTFKDQNADGRLGAADYVPLQPVTQKYYGGIGTNLSYQNWRLDILAQFVKQNGYDYRRSFGNPGNQDANQPVQVVNHWLSPGDISATQMINADQGSDAYSNLQSSNGIITDASFIRIKNLALSYMLPQKWQNPIGSSNARIALQCQNLLTFTKYIGLDPETQSLSLPPLRTIVFNIQASF